MRVLFLTLLMASISIFASEIHNGKTAKKPKTLQLTEEYRVGPEQGEDTAWFGSTLSVDVDDTGRAFVCDSGNTRVVVLNTDGSFSHHIGSQGMGPGEFQIITGLRVLNDNRVAVIETTGPQSKIHYFQPDGTFEKVIQPAFGVIFQGVNIDPSNRNVGGLYVTFDQGSGSMSFVAGTLDLEFKPQITVRSSTRSTPDFARFGEGAYWSEYMGENFRLIKETAAVVFDREGHIYTAVIKNYSISIYDIGKLEPSLVITKEYDPLPNPPEEIEAFVEPTRDAVVSQLPPQLKGIVTEAVIKKAIELAEYPPVKQPVFGLIPIDGFGFAVVHDLDFRSKTQRLDLFSNKGVFFGLKNVRRLWA